MIVAVGLAFALVGCGDDDSASSTDPTASLTSATITVSDLDVTTCDTEGGSDIVLEAITGSSVLQVDAPSGTGTITYTSEEGDTETKGSVSSVTVEEDGSFKLEGSWEDGEALTLTGTTGSCANL
jgi:hypothetical protein